MGILKNFRQDGIINVLLREYLHEALDMSTKIRDILKSPCMHGARVVAGAKHIDQTITSITVMEYTVPGHLQDHMRHTEGIRYNEFSLTGFFDICDDVDAQCEIIRGLMESGIVAMSLYYLGIVVKQLDPRVIRTAEEIGFVLIAMPPGQCDLRYSDAIMEITGLIHKNREQEVYFIPEILDQFSLLPKHRQSIDTLLRILCDRTQTSLIVTDAQWQVLSYATWPLGLQLDVQQVVEQAKLGENPVVSDIRFSSQHAPLEHQGSVVRHVFALNTEQNLLQGGIDQMKELIRLFYNIWEEQQKDVGSDELVRSVIMGETLKIKRVAELIGVDTRSIDSMWVFRSGKGFEAKHQRQLSEKLGIAAEETFPWSALSCYEDSIILLSSSVEAPALAYFKKEVADLIQQPGSAMRGFVVHNIREVQECREAYGKIIEYAETASQIFPGRSVMSFQEIRFAEACCQILSKGDTAIRHHTAALSPLDIPDKQLSKILEETLAVYLLDADCSISTTAARMYVHQNTAKYRINKINDLMCAHVRQMPLNQALAEALALRRLMS